MVHTEPCFDESVYEKSLMPKEPRELANELASSDRRSLRAPKLLIHRNFEISKFQNKFQNNFETYEVDTS